MNTLFALVLALSCPETEMINETNEPWTQEDRDNMSRAKITCKTDYPNSPCLKKFIKRSTRNYWAICSSKV